ncbi:MAG: anti-sigma factor [Bradyrhizobium sp.]
MAHSEDHIALAAEYALGTLDAEERAQVETMMSVDKDFTAAVVAWEHKLGALNQMVGSVEPRPELWEKIKAAIGHSGQQAPIVLPQPAPSAPAADAAPVVTDTSNVIQLAARARRWRAVATATSAIAAALVVMIGVGASMPDLLPDSMRPKSKTQVAQVTPQSAPKASAQYVAVLQKDGGGPAFILTVDEATRNFTVRKVGASADAGSSYELWLISDKLGGKPRSLGVVGADQFTSRPVLASYDPDTVKSATYAVTVEQAGGSPDGNPHSTPILMGKLIETVPPAR